MNLLIDKWYLFHEADKDVDETIIMGQSEE